MTLALVAALAAVGRADDSEERTKLHLQGPIERIDCSKATPSERSMYCSKYCPKAKGGMVIVGKMSSSGKSKKGCDTDDGFFKLSNQCFKAYHDQNTTWPTATSFCESEGLVLAEPKDDVAADLQSYLNEEYGSKTYWVNGKGTGPKVYWQRSEEEVSPSGDLWIFDGPGEYSTRDPYCLILFATDNSMRRFAGRPYDTTECNNEWQKQRTPLCERLMG